MEEIQIINYSFSEKYNMFVCSTGDFTFVYELGFPLLYEFVEKFEIQYRVNSVGYQQKNGFTNEHNKSKLQQVYMQHLTRTIEMIDWSVVDFILISNYTNVLLLPFVTERTEFSGFIYVTEAALEYIKCVLEEPNLIKKHEPTNRIATFSKNDDEYDGLMRIYSEKEIISSYNKVTAVRYNEVVEPVPVIGNLRVQATSAGFCIGSANWKVCYKGQNISMLGASSVAKHGIHPMEFDYSIFKDSKVVLFSDIKEKYRQQIDMDGKGSINEQIDQITTNIAAGIKNDATIIVVAEMHGLVYDIVESVYTHMKGMNVTSTHYWFVSPIAEKTIQYGNIMGEWLNMAKRNALFIPEYPFVVKEMDERGLIKYYKGVDDISQERQLTNSKVIFISPRDFGNLSFIVNMYADPKLNRYTSPNSNNANFKNLLIFTNEMDMHNITKNIEIPETGVMKVLSYDLDNRIDSLQVEHIVTTFEDPNPGQGDGWNGGEIAHANNNESRLIILPKFMQNSMSRYGGESVQSTKQEIQKCDENVALRYYENYEIVQEDLLSLAGGERKTIWIPCMMEKSIVEQVCKEGDDGDNDFGNVGRHGKRKRNHGDSKNVIQGKLEIVGHRECIFRIQNDLGRMSGTKPSISSDGRKGGKSKTVEELVSEMEELDYKIIDTPSSTLLQSADRSFADGINPQKNIVLDNILGTVNITVGVLNDAQRSKHEQQQINISCSNELVLQDVMGVLNSGY